MPAIITELIVDEGNKSPDSSKRPKVVGLEIRIIIRLRRKMTATDIR